MRLVESSAIACPANEIEIWRYIDVAKFLDLVTRNRLFFCNGNALSDRRDGEVANAVLEAKGHELRQSGLSDRDLEERMLTYAFFEANPMRELALFNCWSIGNEESFALWKVYLGEQPFGVAIRSTVGQLLASIAAGNDSYPEDFYVGLVEYRDGAPQDSTHRLKQLTRKLPYYRYENEVRLIILNYPRSEGGTQTPYPLSVGRHVQVDTPTLIQSIVVSPFAPEHFYSSLEHVVGAIAPALAGRIKHSGIADK